MVTPTYGVASFVGRSGRTYSKDIYLADVADDLVNWDSGGGAGAATEQFWTPPEPVVLKDISITTGPTVIFKLQITRDGVPTGDIARLLPHLDTIAFRPQLSIPFMAGQRVALRELV